MMVVFGIVLNDGKVFNDSNFCPAENTFGNFLFLNEKEMEWIFFFGPFQLLASRVCYEPLQSLVTMSPRCLVIERLYSKVFNWKPPESLWRIRLCLILQTKYQPQADFWRFYLTMKTETLNETPFLLFLLYYKWRGWIIIINEILSNYTGIFFYVCLIHII